MAGGVRDLTNTADFPRLVDLTGKEIVPAADTGGAPVSITTETLALFATVVAVKPQYKDPVRIAFASNVDLATVINGATFQGVTLATGDRVGFVGQTDPSTNGIRTVAASGVPPRSTDANTPEKIIAMDFLVLAGTDKRKHYRLKTTGTIVLNTTPLEYVVTDIPSDQSALSEIAAGPAASAPTGRLFAVLNAAKTQIELLSYDGFLAKLNEDIMGPPIYTWPAHGRVTDSSSEIVPADAGLVGFDVVNPGDNEIWLAEGGLPAVIGGLGSVPVQAKGIYSTDKALAGAISIVSSTPGPVTCKFWTRTNSNVAAKAAAKAYTDRIAALYATPLTTAQIDVLQNFYAKLYSGGVFNTVGALYNLLAPGVATNINLSDLNGKLATLKGGVQRQNWRGALFDGASGYFDTQRYMTEIAGENDHSVFAYAADATQQGSTRVAMGDGNITITPNRTNVTAAGRSRVTAIATFADFPAGAGLYSLSRLDSSRIMVRKGQTRELEVAMNADSPVSQRELLIGARNGGASGGEDVPAAGSFYTGTMIVAGAGRKLSSSMHKLIDSAVAELVTAAGAF